MVVPIDGTHTEEVLTENPLILLGTSMKAEGHMLWKSLDEEHIFGMVQQSRTTRRGLSSNTGIDWCSNVKEYRWWLKCQLLEEELLSINNVVRGIQEITANVRDTQVITKVRRTRIARTNSNQ